VIHDRNGRVHRPVGYNAGEALIADYGSRDPEPQQALDDGDPRIDVELALEGKKPSYLARLTGFFRPVVPIYSGERA
jgi:hypothetical protein